MTLRGETGGLTSGTIYSKPSDERRHGVKHFHVGKPNEPCDACGRPLEDKSVHLVGGRG